MQIRELYRRILRYLLAVALIVAITAAFSAIRPILDTTLVALLLLIPVGISTALWGLGPGITAGLCAFLGLNYFFIPPYHTFTIHRTGDLVVVMVFLIVAAVISQLVGRAQAGVAAATAREREATQLYELSTSLAGLSEGWAILRMLAEQLQATFSWEYLEITLAGVAGASVCLPAGMIVPPRPAELTAPIQAARGLLGEMQLWRTPQDISLREKRLVKTFASQAALALERAALAEAESRARLLEDSDRFKSSLLSSVSHELRTPLATIKASASSLRSGEINWDSAARADLLAAIDDEADHLNMLVGNLLDMSRIESGALKPERKWNVLSEIIQNVVVRMRHVVEDHRLIIDIPEDMPLLPVDFVQMEQVFTNLLSNSIKFAPTKTAVRVRARVREDSVAHVQVSNQGPPVPAEHLERIFDKFYRMTAADRVTGTGLGLSICKGIVEAHGGVIWAENLAHGFAFNFTLPLQLDGSPPPNLPREAEAA